MAILSGVPAVNCADRQVVAEREEAHHISETQAHEHEEVPKQRTNPSRVHGVLEHNGHNKSWER